MRLLLPAILLAATALAQLPQANPDLAAARQAIAAKDFTRAHALFAAYAHTHPTDARAFLGLGDADLGLHRYETAEADYRHATSLQPELWTAHKSLVLVEAKLARWEEFDRERAVLRAARERGAPDISPRESDVIDSFTVNGEQWLVREYFVPVGRSETRYNFEHFTPQGRAAEYVSLEHTAPPAATDSVTIGKDTPAPPATKDFSLNWYTGHGHGTVRHYPSEPTYEALRTDVMRWLQQSPSPE